MTAPTEDVAVVFAELGDLEKEFATVELEACTLRARIAMSTSLTF